LYNEEKTNKKQISCVRLRTCIFFLRAEKSEETSIIT